MASCGASSDPTAPPAIPPGSEPARRARDSPAGVRVLRAGALYLALTVVLTYPLALHLRVMDAGDSAFFAWVMAWEAHALESDPGRLPHGNMFHPLRFTLVLLFLFSFFRLGRRRDALLAALFFVLEAYACGYHGVVGLLVLPVATIPLLWGRGGRLPAALLAAAVAAVGLLPLYLLHHAAL